jgi:hypothetical protein
LPIKDFRSGDTGPAEQLKLETDLNLERLQISPKRLTTPFQRRVVNTGLDTSSLTVLPSTGDAALDGAIAR